MLFEYLLAKRFNFQGSPAKELSSTAISVTANNIQFSCLKRLFSVLPSTFSGRVRAPYLRVIARTFDSVGSATERKSKPKNKVETGRPRIAETTKETCIVVCIQVRRLKRKSLVGNESR